MVRLVPAVAITKGMESSGAMAAFDAIVRARAELPEELQNTPIVLSRWNIETQELAVQQQFAGTRPCLVIRTYTAAATQELRQRWGDEWAGVPLIYDDRTPKERVPAAPLNTIAALRAFLAGLTKGLDTAQATPARLDETTGKLAPITPDAPANIILVLARSELQRRMLLERFGRIHRGVTLRYDLLIDAGEEVTPASVQARLDEAARDAGEAKVLTATEREVVVRAIDANSERRLRHLYADGTIQGVPIRIAPANDFKSVMKRCRDRLATALGTRRWTHGVSD